MNSPETSSPDTGIRRIARSDVTFNIAEPPNEFYSSGWDDYESGDWEPFSFESIDNNISSNTVFLDVGAYVGFMSLHVASRVKRVVAFEADPATVPLLRNNFEANPEWSHLEIIDAFVSDSDGAQRMSSHHSGGNSGTTGMIDLGGVSWEVKKIDFVKFLSSISVNDPLMIKMDIEGAEYHVLEACADLLATRKQTCLLLELHPHIIANSIQGQSILSKIKRRWKLTSLHRQCFKKLANFQRILSSNGSSANLSDLGNEILRSGNLAPDHRMILCIND